MAFNHRFPDSVPALDTAALVKLISEPQKAAELWARYEQVRKEYEALQASVRDEVASLNKLNNQLAETEAAFNSAKEGFAKEVSEFDNKREVFKANVVAWENTRLQQQADLLARGNDLEELSARLKVREREIDARMVELKSIEARLSKEHDERVDALAVREAAVAEREAKAEKLAALLKAV